MEFCSNLIINNFGTNNRQMELYTSEYLSIIQEDKTLIQKWTNKVLVAEDYKKELQNFRLIFDKVKPENLLWDTQACRLILPESLNEWTGDTILLPLYQKGIRQLIVNVPDDLSVHLSIIKTLDKARSILQPIYFSNYHEASNYAQQKEIQTPSVSSSIIQYKQDKDKAFYNLNLKVVPNDLPKILTYVNQMAIDNEFIKSHEAHYFSLTVRELEILKAIVLGNTNKEIATKYFIEESTVKTHRKQIKKKLYITSIYDLYQYARCFNLLE